MNFQFSLLQLHTKSLCVLALQNSQFEASTSSRPQTVNFEALGHKAIMYDFSNEICSTAYFSSATLWDMIAVHVFVHLKCFLQCVKQLTARFRLGADT